MKKWIWILAVVLISFFSFKSLIRPGYFPMHDDMQAMRVMQMDKCIKDGQIPCRWVPDMGYGYGYPQFIYYSPLPYYLMEIVHLIGFQFIDSVKIGIAIGFVLSGLSMFLLGRSLWGNFGGFISSVFYLYAPYHASDIYTRGAMGEFWAFVFLPLIFWSVLELFKTEKNKYILYFSLSLAGLLTTHNITTISFVPFLLLWILLLFKIYKKKIFKKIFFGFLISFGLSAFFTLPVVFEKQYAHTETMIMGYFNYLAHFVSFKQLFLSTFWGFGSSELGPYDDLSFSIGIFHWLIPLIVLIITFFEYKKHKNEALIIWSLLFFGFIAIFMTHQKSSFIWSRLSILQYFQFPWRFLTVVTFFFSIISGAIVYFISMKINKIIIGTIIILIVILSNGFYFYPSSWININDKVKFSGELWEKQLTISIFDYLPIFAKMPPDKKAPEFPQVINGEVLFENYQKGSNWQKGTAKLISDSATIRLPIYYFPGMKVYVNNKKTFFTYNNDLGLPTVELKDKVNNIYVKVNNSFVRQLGDIVTLITIIILFYMVILNNKKKFL